jgi:hypothetical protein
MSYFPFNSDENLDKFNPEKMNKKERYHNTDNKNYYCDTPGFWQYEEKSNIIEQETNIITPNIGTRQKTQIELPKNIHPNNYSIPIENKLQNELNEKVYFSGYDTGPGKGFGNLSISNDIRIGNFTRLETKDNKINKESELINRWEYIDDRFKNPNNLVMQLPRGGESTRKNTSEPFTTQSIEQREFQFKY